MRNEIKESYDSYEEWFIEEQRLEESELAELAKKMAPETIKEPREELFFSKISEEF